MTSDRSLCEKMDINALFSITYGVYIISSFEEEKLNGQIATVVNQVTNSPNRIATCLCKENLTHECIEKSGLFGVSVLTQSADLKFIGCFGFRCGRTFDKFEHVAYKLTQNGVPLVLEHTASVLECKVSSKLDLGTHTLFVGDVLGAEILSNEKVMTYDYYHHVIKGKTQKNAPTFVK